MNKPDTSFKPTLIIGMSLVLGLLFDYFFYKKAPGVSFLIYIILIAAGLFLSAKFLERRPGKDVFWLLVPLIFFSAMVFVRASVLLTPLNIAATLILLLVIADVFWGGRLKSFFIKDYIKIIFLPFKFLGPLFQTFGNLISRRKDEKNQRVFSQVARGVMITAPFLLIFIILFSSADLIFQKYISNIVSFDIEPETVFRSILVLFVALVLIGAYSFIFKNLEAKKVREQIGTSFRIGRIESNILLYSVNFLFLVFILVQLTYLFGGENNITAQGFTYAEYARKGFFELIAVAMLSLLLLSALDKFVERRGENHSAAFKTLSTGLIVQVILIMASAYTRLTLYEDAYGLTTLRLYSHVFIIFLAVVFGLLAYKIYWDSRENSFACLVFIAAILFLVSLNILNPDAFIARRNIERFNSSRNLDVFYLVSLSDDAISKATNALNISDENLRNNFARELYWRYQDRKNSSFFTGWQAFNLSRANSDKILESRMGELEQYKDYPRDPNLK